MDNRITDSAGDKYKDNRDVNGMPASNTNHQEDEKKINKLIKNLSKEEDDMDKIQEALIQAGRKDLAQEYYKKIARIRTRIWERDDSYNGKIRNLKGWDGKPYSLKSPLMVISYYGSSSHSSKANKFFGSYIEPHKSSVEFGPSKDINDILDKMPGTKPSSSDIKWLSSIE